MDSLALKISRNHKEKYLAEFSEDDFRDKVLRPLLHRMGFEDGRDLCGPEEQGRDALFAEPHRLGGFRYVAVQTKKGPMTLASKPSKNVVAAIAQLRMAHETSYSVLHSRKMNVRP